ncbi:MAG: ATP-dependent Clp protease ATP-binding subunit ClpX [Lachnospiraceae bacterium]|nr:ATP-dependent Clp protease ATP-binding subunit ClpX [Lachnospiraceae bacterium]
MSDREYCSLCGKFKEDCGELVTITGGLKVCHKCLENTLRMAEKLTGGMPQPPSPPAPPTPPGEEHEDKPGEKPEEPGEKEPAKEPGSVRFAGGFGLPNVGFLSMADLQNMMFGNNPGRKKSKEEKKPPEIDIKNIPMPHKIKELLDEYVVGQEQAKKVMSVAVYNHYKRVASEGMAPEEFEKGLADVEIEKSNVLLIGPTGCGKTYLVRMLAKLLDVPLAITDATSLTEAGYIGDDIESVVSKLLAAADNDVDKAETGIIFIDEIDKIAKKKNSHSRDVSGESVQQGMLKLLEGAEVEVPVGANSKNAMVPLATVDTRNILFICGGAFPDLDEIIKQRLRKQTSIGFNAELKDTLDKRKDILSEVTVEDIKKFGMIPEFVGRLPIICTMQGLTDEMLVDILKEPKNAIIKQYQKLLSMDEVDLEFTDEALLEIAKKAQEKDTGARALRSIIEDIMLDIMYEIPKDDNIGRVTITKEYLEGKGSPKIETRGQ